ncbi:hypothetical protein ACFL0A_02185 [Patescibacteria group bacterium]
MHSGSSNFNDIVVFHEGYILYSKFQENSRKPQMSYNKKMIKLLVKKLFYIFLVLISGTTLLVLITFLIKPEAIEIVPLTTKNLKTPDLKIAPDNSISVILVGDIMLNRGIEYMIEKEGIESLTLF